MRKLLLSVAATALMSSPAYAGHGWLEIAYQNYSPTGQGQVLSAIVWSSFFPTQAACQRAIVYLETHITADGHGPVSAVCAFVPEQ